MFACASNSDAAFPVHGAFDTLYQGFTMALEIGMSRFDQLIRQRTEARRKLAHKLASALIGEAGDQGFDIQLIGSLAQGRFAIHSDIDLLIKSKTSGTDRAAIERIASKHLRHSGIPYDLIFSSDMSSARAEVLVHGGF
jgi:predicted nucleotidyltransferase